MTTIAGPGRDEIQFFSGGGMQSREYGGAPWHRYWCRWQAALCVGVVRRGRLQIFSRQIAVEPWSDAVNYGRIRL